MSYFDSRVGECLVWQVGLIRVVKIEIKVDITVDIMVFVAGTKKNQFSIER